MMIKDLEVSKELSREELAAVRGGSTNIGVAGGAAATQFGLLNFASPQTVVSMPTIVQPNIEVDINLAQLLGSIGTVGQL
jgi:lactobin A/cerein 7B family class IIb bacteriocin